MTRNHLAIIALFCVALFYAGNYTVAKMITPTHIGPFGLTAFRVVCTGVFFWLLSLGWHSESKMERADIGRVALAAFCGVGLNMVTYMWGLSLTTPIAASVLMITTPIIVIVLSALVYGQRVRLINVGGIAIGFIGAVMLIMTTTAKANATNPLLGNILILVNATSYSFYILLAKKLTEKYDPFTLLKWLYLFGMLYLTPLGIKEAYGFLQESHDLSVYLPLGYVILFSTIGTYLLNMFAISVVRPSIVAVFIYLQPLLASAIAISYGSDILDMQKMIAGSLIFVGVYLTTRQ